MNHKVLIIAEAGVNHNGDLDLARKLIDLAAAAGADLVKFQTFNANRLVIHSAKKAAYQMNTSDAEESQYEMLRKLEITEEGHRILMEHCKSCNIGFLSTGFDIESINLLVNLGQEIFKIPSGEITNLPYLRYIGKLGKRIILSTGMATLGEIEAAIEILQSSGTALSSITVLHCTTEYPAPIQEVNLLAMQSIRQAFGVEVGYSDHTSGIEVAVASVALGASVIEKHFTLDRNLPGPDHHASLEFEELRSMVRSIRNIELALGDGIKRLTPSESRNKLAVRKSLFASREIKYGEPFTAENITAKRPGAGISPMRWDEVLGKIAKRDFLVDELIEL
uniref:N-acetylneuraminate synthase n=1 Tax=Polynucleobacter sp. TaxID=2029855 RepID=UPI0040471A8D